MEPAKVTPLPSRKRLSEAEKLLLTSTDIADVKREWRKRSKISSIGRTPADADESDRRKDNSVIEDIHKVTRAIERGAPLDNEDEEWPILDENETIATDSVVSNCSDDTAELLLAAEAGESLADERDDNDSKDHCKHLISFHGLKRMIENGCNCTKCSGKVELTEITIGIATTVFLTCTDCKVKAQVSEPGLPIPGGGTPIDGSVLLSEPAVEPSRRSFKDFPVHYSLVLLMQQLGCGLDGLRSVLTHLGLRKTVGDWVKWRYIMDQIGIAQHDIANECCKNNLRAEILEAKERGMETQVDSKGVTRQGIVVSLDMGWQKRASGNRYDSGSGVSMMIGGWLKKILARHPCSKFCRACDEHTRRHKIIGNDDTNIVPKVRDHRCPKNYTGSSKGMEAHAAVECVKSVFYLSAAVENYLPAFVDITISDDDSTTWANLQQSLEQRLLEHNEALAEQNLPPITSQQCEWWPKTTKGKPKDDHGKLSVHELAPRVNLADPNHRTKVLGKHLYPLTGVRKSSGKKISKAMAERLKLHFGKALHQNRHKEGAELRLALLASLEHEFGNHEHCSKDWCRYLKAKTDEARSDLAPRWMNKEDDATLYEALRSIYEVFLSPLKIQQMHHSHDTQKNEALNNKIVRCCPKTKTFSKSMVLFDRVDWVVIEDSIGGEAAVIAIFKKLGFCNAPQLVMDYYIYNDKRRARHSNYVAKKEVKHRRRKTLNEKIWAERAQVKTDREKGKEYGSGVAFDQPNLTKKPPKTTAAADKRCAACGGAGHSRRSHRLCPFNKTYVTQVDASVAQFKQATDNMTEATAKANVSSPTLATPFRGREEEDRR